MSHITPDAPFFQVVSSRPQNPGVQKRYLLQSRPTNAIVLALRPTLHAVVNHKYRGGPGLTHPPRRPHLIHATGDKSCAALPRCGRRESLEAVVATSLATTIQKRNDGVKRKGEGESGSRRPRGSPAKTPMMPLEIRHDLTTVDDTSFPYVFEQNVSIPLQSSPAYVRCNVYRPKDGAGKWPVLVTYGPYGKDIPYKESVAIAISSLLVFHDYADPRAQLPCAIIRRSQPAAPFRACVVGNARSGLLDISWLCCRPRGRAWHWPVIWTPGHYVERN
jgi:hypothetical protein